MPNNNITVSGDFKKRAARAILSVLSFISIYMLLILLAVVLTILCGYAGIMLIAAKPMFFTLVVGAGIVSMGALVLIFLIKFIFKKHTVDRSHLIEITREEEPLLFEYIDTIVREVNTSFPKKIYLSADVNASVFYDSNFWSMIFPIRKNLLIGIGLVNSVSVLELKAILAHEFGHFSQRTMKVGSYVYNANQIIYNMLYENESYDALAQRWANINRYFSFFVGVAINIVKGIQRLLRNVYETLNINYMGLSREMEFNADEVAANVSGSKPLMTSLLRLELADYSYKVIIDYYDKNITDAVITQNIYPQQYFVMNALAKDSKVPIINNLPQVNLEHVRKYKGSKLAIHNQWASHPATEERVRRLNMLNIEKEQDDGQPASALFRTMGDTQTMVTQKLFSAISYTNPTVWKETEQFITEYLKESQSDSLGEIFNGYYNQKNIAIIDLDNTHLSDHELKTSVQLLFGNKMTDLVITALAMTNDINTLKQISQNDAEIKSFDYDGNKYFPKDCSMLIKKAEADLQEMNNEIAENDMNIYKYFLALAIQQGKKDELLLRYSVFIKYDRAYDAGFETYSEMVQSSGFIQETKPYDVIEQNMPLLKQAEKEFKSKIEIMVNEDIFQRELTGEMKDLFTTYLSKDWIYFSRPEYDNDALKVLFDSMNNFRIVLSKTYMNVKKGLLGYYEELGKK